MATPAQRAASAARRARSRIGGLASRVAVRKANMLIDQAVRNLAKARGVAAEDIYRSYLNNAPELERALKDEIARLESTPELRTQAGDRIQEYMRENTATLPGDQRQAAPEEMPQEGGVSYEPSPIEDAALGIELSADQPDVRGGSFDEPRMQGDAAPRPRTRKSTVDSVKDLAAETRQSGPVMPPDPRQGRRVGSPAQPNDLDTRTLRLMDVGSATGGRRRKMVGRQTISESGDITLTDPVSGTLYYVGDTPVFLDESGRMLRFDSADAAPKEITNPAEFQLLLRQAGDVQPTLANPLNDPVASERILGRLPQRAEGLDVEVIGEMLRAFDTEDGLFPTEVNLENLRRVVTEMELRYAMDSDSAQDALAEAFGGVGARNPEQYADALQRGIAAFGRAREMLAGLEQAGGSVAPNRVVRDQIDYRRPNPGITLEPQGELSVAEKSRPGAQPQDEMLVDGQVYRRSEGGLDQLNELKAATGEELADANRIIDEIENASGRGIDSVDFNALEQLATKYVGAETGMGDVAVAVLEAIEGRDISGISAAKLFAQDRLNELNRLNAEIDMAFSGREYIPERVSVGPDGEVTGSTLGSPRVEGGTRFVMKGDGEFEPYSPEIHGEVGPDGVTANGERTVQVTSSPDEPENPASRPAASMPQAFSQARTVMAAALRSRGVRVPPALARVLETRPRASRVPPQEVLQDLGYEIQRLEKRIRVLDKSSPEYKKARSALKRAKTQASKIAEQSGDTSSATVAAESINRAKEGWSGTQQEFLETQLRVNDPAVVEAFNRIDPSREAPADLTPAERKAREYLQSQEMSAPEALNYLITGRDNPELLRNLELLRGRAETTDARIARLKPSLATRATELVLGPGEKGLRRKRLLDDLAKQRENISAALEKANQSPLTSPGAIETRLGEPASQPVVYESRAAIPADSRTRVGEAPARSPDYERFHALIDRFGDQPLRVGFSQDQMDIAAAALSDLSRIEQSLDRPNASKLYEDYDLRRDEVDYLKDYFARGLERDPSGIVYDSPQPRPKDEPGQPAASEPGVTPKVDATLADKIAEYRSRFDGVEDADITSKLAALDELAEVLDPSKPRGQRVTGADRKRYVDEAAKIFRELNEYEVYDPRYDFSDVEMMPRNMREVRLRRTAKAIDGSTLYFPDRKTATAAAAFRDGKMPEALPENIVSELEALGMEVDRTGVPKASFQEYADGSKAVVIDLPIKMSATSGQPGPGGRINPPAGEAVGMLAEPGESIGTPTGPVQVGSAPRKPGSGSDALRRYINDQRAAGDLSARKAGGVTAGIQNAKSIQIEIPAYEDLTAAIDNPNEVARAFALDGKTNSIRALERDPVKLQDKAARERLKGTMFDPDSIKTSLWSAPEAEADFSPVGESFTYEGTPFNYEDAPANQMPDATPAPRAADEPDVEIDVEGEMERLARQDELAAEQLREREFADEAELELQEGDVIDPAARPTEPVPDRVRSLQKARNGGEPDAPAQPQAPAGPSRRGRRALLLGAATLPFLGGAATKESTGMDQPMPSDAEPAGYSPVEDINAGEPVRELTARERIADRLAALRGVRRRPRTLRYGTTQLYTPNFN